MGKAQKKTGKGRLDKYYKLAKYVLTEVDTTDTVFTRGFFPSI